MDAGPLVVDEDRSAKTVVQARSSEMDGEGKEADGEDRKGRIRKMEMRFERR